MIIKANKEFLKTLTIKGIKNVMKYINTKLNLFLRLKIILNIITAEIAKNILSAPPHPSEITNSESPKNILLSIKIGSKPKHINVNKVRYFVKKSKIGLKI